MNARTFFFLATISLLILSVVIAGCSSGTPSVRELSPSLTSSPWDKTRELAMGNTAIVSSPEGILEITVRAFNATTGKILVEEKNIGTEDFQYNPKIWLQDGGGVNYAPVCHADLCPSSVFFTTLPPLATEKRDLIFRVPEQGHQGKLILYWSNAGQEAAWILTPV